MVSQGLLCGAASLLLVKDMTHRILILGGTTEARQFAGAIAARADLDITLSLAGRTANPVPHPVPVRIGGFGGVEGLARHLIDNRIDMLIDATHPFAAVICVNAAAAAQLAGVDFFALRRPEWTKRPGDNWTSAGSVTEAVALCGLMPPPVFVTLGRQELAPFLAAPHHHYLVRSVDPVEPPLALPHVEYVLARGPFDVEEETRLLQEHCIELIISKNSGGTAAEAKLTAARALGVEVIMIVRPPKPDVPCVGGVAKAVAMLDHLLTPGIERGE
jgi:precorrin-6A/cobalt-precorrin-6A reductase